MNNVVNFRLKTYEVSFILPVDKVIEIYKSRYDNVSLNIIGNCGDAMVPATSESDAGRKIRKIFPKSNIVKITETT